MDGGAGEGAGVEGVEKSGSCASSGEAACWGMTLSAGFQRVVVPQRLQERRTLWLEAQTSASTLESSIFSRVLQMMQTRARTPSSISEELTGGKSISQKLRFSSKKATP